jgi:hypothetical protein
VNNIKPGDLLRFNTDVAHNIYKTYLFVIDINKEIVLVNTKRETKEWLPLALFKLASDVFNDTAC